MIFHYAKLESERTIDMIKRTCGGCTACCKTHAVHSMYKRAWEWCLQCKIGDGCRIYNTRPTDCENFQCAWLLGVGGPDYRPDKIGVVVDYIEVPHIGIVMCFREFDEGIFESRLVRSWTMRNILSGNCVLHAYLNGSVNFYLSEKADVSGLSFVMGNSDKPINVIPFSNALF